MELRPVPHSRALILHAYPHITTQHAVISPLKCANVPCITTLTLFLCSLQQASEQVRMPQRGHLYMLVFSSQMPHALPSACITCFFEVAWRNAAIAKIARVTRPGSEVARGNDGELQRMHLRKVHKSHHIHLCMLWVGHHRVFVAGKGFELSELHARKACAGNTAKGIANCVAAFRTKGARRSVRVTRRSHQREEEREKKGRRKEALLLRLRLAASSSYLRSRVGVLERDLPTKSHTPHHIRSHSAQRQPLQSAEHANGRSLQRSKHFNGRLQQPQQQQLTMALT